MDSPELNEPNEKVLALASYRAAKGNLEAQGPAAVLAAIAVLVAVFVWVVSAATDISVAGTGGGFPNTLHSHLVVNPGGEESEARSYELLMAPVDGTPSSGNLADTVFRDGMFLFAALAILLVGMLVVASLLNILRAARLAALEVIRCRRDAFRGDVHAERLSSAQAPVERRIGALEAALRGATQETQENTAILAETIQASAAESRELLRHMVNGAANRRVERERIRAMRRRRTR